jgi:flagellar biosynthesis/type III secretory pathway chaperone
MTVSHEDMLAQLDRQIDAMRKVQFSLGAERQALIERNAEALEAALADKNQWLTRAAELEKSRQTMRLDDKDSDELSLRWSVLTDLTAQCQAKNAENGALIRGQRRLVQNTLEWLRGDPDGPGPYGPDGTKRGTHSRATLASV